MVMKLTQRQNDFLDKLIELSQGSPNPVHYSELAKKLGVSDITAYDMLRLLEEKGIVSSQYEVKEKPGPGRSKITFIPTPRALQLKEALSMKESGERWQAIKERVMVKLAKDGFEADDLLKEFMARVPPENRSPLQDCVEIMTILTLRLRRSAGRDLLLEFLPTIMPSTDQASRANLNLLGGFTMGILAQENKDDPVWGAELLVHVKRYQALVIDMSDKERGRLAAQLMQVFETLKDLV